MYKKKYFLLIIFLIAVFAIFVFSKRNKEMGDIELDSSFNKNYSIYALNLPDSILFANEEVPMDFFDVREAFDQELLINTYWQSQTLLFIKRANRYFPTIEKILDENKIPNDFKYIALVESDLKNRVSASGAVGIWQLLESTALDYGLEVNSEIDERYNLEKSTEVACKYFSDAYELFGSWTMAAASYNMGRNGLLKQVKRQKQESYYNLLLNSETERYIYRLLAIKLIIENPKKYGFNLREKDLYYPIPYYEVKIDSSIDDFANYASKYGINYKILKYFNPWIRDSFLTNTSRKEYLIKIPEKGYRNYKILK